MVRNDTSKKGGDAPRATDYKRKRGVCRCILYFNPPQASLKDVVVPPVAVLPLAIVPPITVVECSKKYLYRKK